MPYLMVQTNQKLDSQQEQTVTAEASRLVAGQLGKPEGYVMTALESGVAMSFAGSDAPCAYMELKSLGLPEGRTPEFSQALCAFAQEHLGVDHDRVYIEFAGPDRHMWGFKGSTF